MKKKIGLILALIIVIIFLSVKLYPIVFYVSMEDTLGIKTSEVNKIELFNGSTGKSIEILEKNEIDEILSKYKNTKVKKELNQEIRFGFSLGTTLYKNNKRIAYFDSHDNYAHISRKNSGVKYYTAIDAPNIEAIEEIEEKYNLD
ncbi:hypothetical protein U732_3734 [Clostridium argentinense CDC 2741]|uniref:Uncharacterized protein n=1 Tax=Clostridium argentinense CDC 2741 TaxID=1418104 RepID=A0A0C1U4M2_9CLOT|nr:hypothetical protein [Clostridium argentinense]ARC86123.1 hypothetical protein RSJ17_17295 [Clostridium argentinense]KIE47729.1 hypothetical protein U732_3734 [Clostridium argentinense CDC 2741]NFF40366.1 hypothetical protein [Clostridium argentinense]NFP50173.1 hypothetical protein [Clostridium argentinense]NFP72688.1 hypothetical protein [Clostridium argentinense]